MITHISQNCAQDFNARSGHDPDRALATTGFEGKSRADSGSSPKSCVDVINVWSTAWDRAVALSLFVPPVVGLWERVCVRLSFLYRPCGDEVHVIAGSDVWWCVMCKLKVQQAGFCASSGAGGTINRMSVILMYELWDGVEVINNICSY